MIKAYSRPGIFNHSNDLSNKQWIENIQSPQK